MEKKQNQEDFFRSRLLTLCESLCLNLVVFCVVVLSEVSRKEYSHTDHPFLSFLLQSMRSSETTCQASPSTATHSFPSPPKLTQETLPPPSKKKEGKRQTELTLCCACLDYSLQEATTGNARRTNVNVLSRWPGSNVCLVFFIYNAFTQNLSKE